MLKIGYGFQEVKLVTLKPTELFKIAPLGESLFIVMDSAHSSLESKINTLNLTNGAITSLDEELLVTKIEGNLIISFS